MKKLLIALSLLLILLSSGCGYKEGVLSEQRQSSIYFSGNTRGLTVSIDGGEEFKVSPGRNNQYRIKPGKHDIRVYRGENIIVDRRIYLGDGVAKEIGVH
ncbi:MAG: hypothetical protein J7L21_06730 [Sulfurimonas sp.]|nr:hypothetical protein [Sulfurimonas sp.]